MPLEDVIRIAHSRGVPVVVDAAAQLPPVENLWRFTGMGADMVIFSGGKTLCGPQDSGLIVGKKQYIEDCIRFGAPMHGVCRGNKSSRESMAGLYSALKQYVEMDHAENRRRLERVVETMAQGLASCSCTTRMVPYGPVGQDYTRLFVDLKTPDSAQCVWEEMRRRHIYVGLDRAQNAVYISPLNLNENEQKIVVAALREAIEETGL